MAVLGPNVDSEGIKEPIYDQCGLLFDLELDQTGASTYKYGDIIDIKCNQRSRALMCTMLGILLSKTMFSDIKSLKILAPMDKSLCTSFRYICISESETPIECPATNPYSFKQGRACCKNKKEDVGDCNSRPCDSTCDGGDLSIASNCCENGASLPCPDGKLCIDGDVFGGRNYSQFICAVIDHLIIRIFYLYIFS